jgi:hypothetical protein
VKKIDEARAQKYNANLLANFQVVDFSAFMPANLA